jgi:stage II sporulation protein GA (sporulation sigma-E factor processing peptidase)
MTVYIEYVIIDNVVIDYLMLKATFALTGIRSSRGRLFLCSFFGAAVALIYPLIESVTAISVVLKILSGLLIVCLAAKYNTVKSYYINAVVFFCFTFLTGGAIIGVFSLFSIPYSAELSVALMAIPAYFIIRAVSEVLKFVYRRKDVVKLTYKLDLTLLGRVVPAVGFLDTGNALYDGDNAVIVTDKKFFLALAGDNLIKLKLKKLNNHEHHPFYQGLALDAQPQEVSDLCHHCDSHRYSRLVPGRQPGQHGHDGRRRDGHHRCRGRQARR